MSGHLLSLLSKITDPEHISEFKLVKDSNSNIVNDLLIHNTIPVTLYDNLLIFRDTGKELELEGDLLKMITNKNYNVDLASLSDKKMLYDFEKEMHFDVKYPGNKRTKDRSLIGFLKSPGIIVAASGVSSSHRTRFLSPDPNELCDRLNLLLQEKQAGNISDITNKEIVAIVDKRLEYNCVSTKEHKILLIKCLN